MKTSLEMGCTTMWMYLSLLNGTLKNGYDGKSYVIYIFTTIKKKTEKLSRLIDEKCLSEDRNGKQSPKTGLEQTLAQSRGCSEGTVPGAFFKIRVLYSKMCCFWKLAVQCHLVVPVHWQQSRWSYETVINTSGIHGPELLRASLRIEQNFSNCP